MELILIAGLVLFIFSRCLAGPDEEMSMSQFDADLEARRKRRAYRMCMRDAERLRQAKTDLLQEQLTRGAE